jgi:hypothetical protein
MKDIDLIKVGYHKGKMDFGVTSVGDLTYEQLKEMREMIVVAIGVAENMWKKNHTPPVGCSEMNNKDKYGVEI